MFTRIFWIRLIKSQLKYIAIKIFFTLLIYVIPVNAETIKIGLGSCLDQDYPQPIWKSVENEDISYFVFLGDNVYGDSLSGSLKKMERAYAKQKSIFPGFLDEIEMHAAAMIGQL